VRKLLTSELERPGVELAKQLPKAPIAVVLDNVRSALNVGSFFRTCDAFAIEVLVLCGITATPPHKEIQKTAIGATESVKWEYYPNTISALGQLKDRGYEIWGVEQTDESIELMEMDLAENRAIALVFGNEVDGIDDEIIPYLDGALEIKQLGSKHSLNVAVCGGVVLHHFVRKHFKGR